MISLRLCVWVLGLVLLHAGRLWAGTIPREDLAGRRAIRGTAAEETHESESLQLLYRFEEEQLARETLRLPPAGSAAPADEAMPVWLDDLVLPDLPLRADPRIQRYLDFYRNDRRGRAIMRGWLKALGRYQGLIGDALDSAHLPSALVYVALIESSFDPHTRSAPGAVGLWQFMPAVARIYGLRVDHWVDDRKNPEVSTHKVMRYLADLHARFGSWPLALAAFNAGYGAVLRAVAKYNTNDYWSLCSYENGLPWETMLYVPKILAVAIVAENRAAFGFDDVMPDPPWHYERVEVGASMRLDQVADAAGVSPDEVRRLNPELRRDRTPPEPWSLRLPPGSAPRFYAQRDKYREALAVHVVKLGERLRDVAAAVGTRITELRRINSLRDDSEVQPGLSLLVPAGHRSQPVAAPASDVTEPVLVAVPDKDEVMPERRRVFYAVRPGDRLADIAAGFHVDTAEILRWNRLDPQATLSSHQVLQLWIEPAFDTSAAPLLAPARVRLVTVGSDEFFLIVEALRGRKRMVHAVRPGETLGSIAARYRLTAADLERINRLSRTSALAAGQGIVVYVPMSSAEKLDAERRWRDGTLGRPEPLTPEPSSPSSPLAEVPAGAAETPTREPPGETGQVGSTPPGRPLD